MMRDKNDQKGMTLVEVIVAMAILAVVVAPTLRIFASTSGTNLRSRMRQRATSVAEGTMEIFKAYNMDALCAQFDSNTANKAWESSDAAHPTTLQVNAFYNTSPGTSHSVVRPDGSIVDDADYYEFRVRNAASEGQFYDMLIRVTPSDRPGDVLSMENANAYSDAIILMKEDDLYKAQGELEDKAKLAFETEFPSLHSGASSHSVDGVEMKDFKRVINLDVQDDGSAQKVVRKVSYTATATVKYTYSSGGSVSSNSKEYSVSYDEVLDPVTGAVEQTEYDNSGTIAGVQILEKHCKLNRIYLYYFPAYEAKFGSGAEDEINLTGSLTNLYSSAGVVDDPEARGYTPLEFVVVKQVSTRLSDVELNNSEMSYDVAVNNSVTGGGEVKLLSNLGEHWTTSVATPPDIDEDTYEEVKSLADGAKDSVTMLYDVEIHMYEQGTMDTAAANEIATFIGSKNE